MAKYREPVPANYPLNVDGFVCQLEIDKDIELHNGDYGEKTSYLREGVVIPAYDTVKEKNTEIDK